MSAKFPRGGGGSRTFFSSSKTDKIWNRILANNMAPDQTDHMSLGFTLFDALIEVDWSAFEYE